MNSQLLRVPWFVQLPGRLQMDLRMLQDEWFALQVRTRRERLCAQILRGKGYEEFLPLSRRRVGESRGTDEDGAQPLFPGYIFCKLTADASGPVLTTPGVIRFVGYGRMPIPISREEISNIRSMVNSGWPTYSWNHAAIGQRVRINCGPLRGISGGLLRTKSVDRLVVTIDMLQRSAAVEIDLECVGLESIPSLGANSA